MTLFIALDIITFVDFINFAVVAELVYAHDSGSCPITWMRVRLPSTALIFHIDKGLIKKSDLFSTIIYYIFLITIFIGISSSVIILILA